MKNVTPWLKRILYFFLAIIWLIVMVFPLTSFLLATRGEIRLGGDNRSYIRLFIVQEDNANGVGIEWARTFFQAENCNKTTVTYFMWEGKSDNVSFCQCYDAVTNAPLPVGTASCT